VHQIGLPICALFVVLFRFRNALSIGPSSSSAAFEALVSSAPQFSRSCCRQSVSRRWIPIRCQSVFAQFFPGIIVFCLPVGLVLLLVFYAVRLPIVALLPDGFRQVFLPLCQKPVDSFSRIVVSLLIGAGTHLFLDSIAHENGSLVERCLSFSIP
jgi:hypothetical protein